MLLPDTFDEFVPDERKKLRGYDGDVKASGSSLIRGLDDDRGPGNHWQRKVERLNTLPRYDQNPSVRSGPCPAGPTLGCVDAGTLLGLVVGDLSGQGLVHGSGHRSAGLEACRPRLIVSETVKGGRPLLDLGYFRRSQGGGTEEPERNTHREAQACSQRHRMPPICRSLICVITTPVITINSPTARIIVNGRRTAPASAK